MIYLNFLIILILIIFYTIIIFSFLYIKNKFIIESNSFFDSIY